MAKMTAAEREQQTADLADDLALWVDNTERLYLLKARLIKQMIQYPERTNVRWYLRHLAGVARADYRARVGKMTIPAMERYVRALEAEVPQEIADGEWAWVLEDPQLR